MSDTSKSTDQAAKDDADAPVPVQGAHRANIKTVEPEAGDAKSTEQAGAASQHDETASASSDTGPATPAPKPAAAAVAKQDEKQDKKPDAKQDEKSDATQDKKPDKKQDDKEAEPASKSEKKEQRRERSKEAGKAVKAGSDAVRSRIASIVWLIAVVCALFLAVGALLVALGANAGNAVFDFITAGAEALDGPLSREDGLFTFDGKSADTKNVLVNWGLAAVFYLVLGKVLDRVIRP